MPPTLRSLLARPELGLRLLSAEGELPEAALDTLVTWVHSSDLDDPTPFLGEGQVLLTTGTQFGDVVEVAASVGDAYVARLAERGIAGLGFGTEVIRAGSPEALVAACRAHGIPLFEVPYRTPFIAIARANADALAEDAYARRSWALAAQRAISLAALRPDGLSATLSELSRQLDRWVGLFDAVGTLDREFPEQGLDADALEAVRLEATALLRRGQRASVPVTAGGMNLTLQTLGRGGQLRGVLALGGRDELDQAGRDVVTSVIALAGLALEQNHDLDRARALLRSGLLHVLLGDEPSLADRISGEMWGPLPGAPIRVAVADAPSERLAAVAELLELRVEERRGRLFFGQQADTLVLCIEEADRGVLDELVEAFGLHLGVSDAADYEHFARAHEQALRALERSRESSPGVVEFEQLARQGVLAFLARTDAREVARATLAPLAEHDEANGTAIVETLRVWLENGAQFDAAAGALGVHRHTVRSRIALAERLLDRDLSGFHARADLWAALLATG